MLLCPKIFHFLFGQRLIFDPVVVHLRRPVILDTEKAGEGIDVICEALPLVVFVSDLLISEARSERLTTRCEVGDIFALLFIIPVLCRYL